MVVISFVLLFSVTVHAAENDIQNTINSVVITNVQAVQAENLDAVMKTIHTQSPGYLTTKQQLQPLFDNHDLKYQILSFTYIGRDNQYAVARVKQSTQKLSGPTFHNNVLDMIQVFRQEKGQWKFWNQAILEVTYVNQ
ncbi:MAG: hypothetical protein LJE88_02745 [Deltaproteobacteria bacterium]|nr:hypothetical protein [Deltaproteobacteria bacterium]